MLGEADWYDEDDKTEPVAAVSIVDMTEMCVTNGRPPARVLHSSIDGRSYFHRRAGARPRGRRHRPFPLSSVRRACFSEPQAARQPSPSTVFRPFEKHHRASGERRGRLRYCHPGSIMVRPQRQQQVIANQDSDTEENEREASTEVAEFTRSDVIQYVFEHYDMTPAEIDAMFHTGAEDARNIKNAARKRRSRILERGGIPGPTQPKKPAQSTSRNTSDSISSIASAALGNDRTGSPQPSSSSSSGEHLAANHNDRKRRINEISGSVQETLIGHPESNVYNLDTMLQSFDQSQPPRKASKIKIFGEPGSTAIVRTGATEFSIKVPNGQFMEIEF